QRACHLEQTVSGAQRQAEAFAGTFQPLLVVIAEPAVVAQSGEVEKAVGAALASQLGLPCLGDPRGDAGTALAGHGSSVQRGRLAGDGQVQVDAIEQRAGKLAAIALNLVWRAAAAATRVAEVAARAGVHCRYQLETRGKSHLVAGPGDDDVPRLQRLTQDLEHLAVDLGQFIQTRYAV